MVNMCLEYEYVCTSKCAYQRTNSVFNYEFEIKKQT